MVISENSIDAFAADDPPTPDATACDIAQRCPQVLTRGTPSRRCDRCRVLGATYALAATATGFKER
jgi:hypothetical protein